MVAFAFHANYIDNKLFRHFNRKLFEYITSGRFSFLPDLKTALVERSDFSSGTSSRSTKLIHGGVRYLQKAIMQLDYEQVPLPFFSKLVVFVSSFCRISLPSRAFEILLLCLKQYMMVKEALHERANLLEIAPHLSAPLPIMLPVYK